MKQLLLTKKNQNGVGLLEALIAIALSSIIILGAVYSTSRILVSQKEKNLQYIVINDLRNKLQNATVAEKKDWCKEVDPVVPNISYPQESDVINIKVTCESMKIAVISSSETYNKTIEDESQPIVTFRFEIDSTLLGGKVTMGEILK